MTSAPGRRGRGEGGGHGRMGEAGQRRDTPPSASVGQWAPPPAPRLPEWYERRSPGKVRAEPERRPDRHRSKTATTSATDMSHGKRTDMLPEIAAAVGFLSSLLRTRGCVSEQRLKVFSRALQDALTGEHTSGSWSHRGAATPCLGCLSSPFLGRGPLREQLRVSDVLL